ncbi:MAG: hypothetical protein MSA09_05080 [Lachnospiraceae bacterium]|nr:hypothetical protein [Lachnospiraceae bacterium]
MKKSFMTRALATGLSLAMAFSLSAATNVSVASAAAKPAMKSSTMTVKVGQSKNYQATAATQKAYKITAIKMSAAGKTKATVKINSSKKSIKVTGKAATKGSNVIVTFKNNSTKKLTKVTTKVVVKEEAPKVATIKEVAQNTATKLTATLATAIEKVDLADLNIVRDDSNSVIAVKSATIDSTDATKLVIETYADMTDGKSYTVTYTAQDEAKTQSSAKFTATDGTIADFALSTASITANKATTIKYSALDAKGVVIYEKEINNTSNGVEIAVTCDNGYQDGSKLVLMSAGNTAKVVITYHTYKYDTEGNETGVIKKEFTVTAVDANATVSNFVYTIVDNQNDIPAWENLTANTKLAMNDGTKYVKFQIKDSNNENVTTSCGYTVESSNSNILLASGDANVATIVPVAEGTAYLILKDGSKTITTLPITVVAKRVIANFALDKTSVSIATDAAADAPGATFIGYSMKDQYGATLSGATVTDIKCVSKPSNATEPTVINGSGKILIYAPITATKGSYTYTVTATDAEKKTQTKSFSVNVVSPGASASTDYVLQFVGAAGSADGTNAISSMDATVNKVTTASKSIAVNIAKRQSGVIVGGLNLSTVTVSSIKVVGSNGTTYVSANSARTGTVTTAAIDDSAVDTAFANTDPDGTVFSINVVDITNKGTTGTTKNLPAGSYTVTVELNEKLANSTNTVKRTVVNNFKITDSQPVLTATVLATTTGYNDLTDVVKDKDLMKYVYGGVTLDTTKVKFVKADSVKNGKTCVVKTVTIAIPVPGTNDADYVQMTVPVNRVFTTTNASDWV